MQGIWGAAVLLLERSWRRSQSCEHGHLTFSAAHQRFDYRRRRFFIRESRQSVCRLRAAADDSVAMRLLVISLFSAFLSTSGFCQTKAGGEQPSFGGQHVVSIE